MLEAGTAAPLSSIQASSMRRKLSGLGSVSGVYRDAWMLRNCSRSWFTSDAAKPAVRRRSKPRGAGDIVDDDVFGVEMFRLGLDDGWWGWEEEVVGGGRAAACASACRSEGSSSSPMLQFT
jgi:hypothetical protein